MGLFAIRFGASRFFRTRIARKFSFDVTVRMILRELNKLCRVSKCLNRFCQRFCNCSNVGPNRLTGTVAIGIAGIRH